MSLKGFFWYAAVLWSGLALAEANNQPSTFLSATPHLNFSRQIAENMAYSLGAEAGIRNARVNGTFGWKMNDFHLFKLSSEYLIQKINYNFLRGNTNQWVRQAAVGGRYQYEIPNLKLNPLFDFQVYYSNAPSKFLSTFPEFYLDMGNLQILTSQRRIAGSSAFGVAPGITIEPLNTTKIGAELNWDEIVYRRIFSSRQKINGFGATVHAQQMLSPKITLNSSAAFRQLFNNYQGGLTWRNEQLLKSWSLGVYGEYTQGKNQLPNTYNAGFNISYLSDQGSINDSIEINNLTFSPNLLEWTKDPAVRMPQVLAVPEEQIVSQSIQPPCIPPSFQGVITGGDPLVPVFFDSFIYNLTSNFSGPNITYTINFNGQADNGSLTINNSLLSGNGNYPNFAYTGISITATNGCDSVTSNTFDVVVSSS